MKAILIVVIVSASILALAQNPPNPSLGEQIADNLAQKAGATPEAWLQAHPSEKLEMFNGRALANDTQEWCARTVVSHSATEGRAWIRAVYFYDPEPPADDVLPPAGASKQEVLETTCQLGLVWIEIPEANPASGTGLALQIEVGLQSHYGAEQYRNSREASVLRHGFRNVSGKLTARRSQLPTTRAEGDAYYYAWHSQIPTPSTTSPPTLGKHRLKSLPSKIK